MFDIVVAWPRAARVICTSIVRLDLTRILPYVAVNKDAFPSNPAQPRRLHQIIQLAKTSPNPSSSRSPGVFSRENSSAIAGFRSLCGHSGAALKSLRAQSDLRFWNLSIGGLSL